MNYRQYYTAVLLIAALVAVSCANNFQGQRIVRSTTATPSSSDASTTQVVGSSTAAPVPGARAEDEGLFSRLVIANKRIDEEHWGLTFQDSEKACQEMVKLVHQVSQTDEVNEENAEMRTIVDRMLGNRLHKIEGKTAVDLDGHLIAIHSMSEYDMLGSFFARLPGDIYWTGGKLVRYMTPNSKNGERKYRLVLSWTDGTTTNPYDLGIDQDRVAEMTEGTEYCLAFNTVNGQWQARNCEDHLPYACLLQHAHVSTDSGFAIDQSSSTNTMFPGTTPMVSTTVKA